MKVSCYNYVDDAVLGYHEHRGEGSITGDIIMLGRKNIVIRTGEGLLETSFWKSSAIHGNYVVISCGTVLLTGSVVGKNTMICQFVSLAVLCP